MQWDPERSPQLQPLPYRTLQLRLSGTAVDRYIDEWIASVADITLTVHALHDQVRAGDHSGLPDERAYRLPPELHGPGAAHEADGYRLAERNDQ